MKNELKDLLTQEKLVDLLCTATYGSAWLDCFAPNRKGIIVEENDCREDIWAKALLAGHRIEVVDFYAEGDTYGELESHLDEEGNATYLVGLKDIIEGLERCEYGTFNVADDDEADSVLRCFNDFIEGEGDMDNPEAETLMQIILFNELIYA